jgi:hypothetical protein
MDCDEQLVNGTVVSQVVGLAAVMTHDASQLISEKLRPDLSKQCIMAEGT